MPSVYRNTRVSSHRLTREWEAALDRDLNARFRHADWVWLTRRPRKSSNRKSVWGSREGGPMSTIIGCVPERHLWLRPAAWFPRGVLHRPTRPPGTEIEGLVVLDR